AGEVDPDAVAAEAQEAAAGALVAGMTGTASIGKDGLVEAGCSAIAFSATLRAGVGRADTGDPRTVGRDATAQAVAALDDAPYGVVLLFVDSAAGGPGGAVSDGVVACAIGSSTPIGVGVAHGCVPRGVPSIVTRSEGPRVIQLDGRPGRDVTSAKL